jgi:hypothetical protein
MTDHDLPILSKAGADRASERKPAAGSLPPVLLRLAVRRVQVMAVVMLGLVLIGWVTNLLEGELVLEFQHFGEWGPPTFMLAASLGMLGLARLSRVAPTTVVTTALAYEVVVSWGIAFSTYWDTFGNMTPIQMEADVVGHTGAGWCIGTSNRPTSFCASVPSETTSSRCSTSGW